MTSGTLATFLTCVLHTHPTLVHRHGQGHHKVHCGPQEGDAAALIRFNLRADSGLSVRHSPVLGLRNNFGCGFRAPLRETLHALQSGPLDNQLRTSGEHAGNRISLLGPLRHSQLPPQMFNHTEESIDSCLLGSLRDVVVGWWVVGWWVHQSVYAFWWLLQVATTGNSALSMVGNSALSMESIVLTRQASVRVKCTPAAQGEAGEA